MDTLVQRGELRRRAKQKNLLTNTVQIAESEDFADVQVITLRQFLKERAYDKAWHECSCPNEVEGYARRLLHTEFTHAREFVDISKKGIQVGVNVSEIDDKAIDRAVALMVQSETLESGHKFEFGERVKVYDSDNP